MCIRDRLLIGVHPTSANTELWNFENTHMTFATNNQLRMRISNDGNVGINNSDLTIVINYESSNLMQKIKKQKKMFEALEANKSIIIDVPKKTNREIWKDISNTIESSCRSL